MKTTTILNRAFEHPFDGWYHIEAKGDHKNEAANIVQVIDDDACAAIVNRFNADAAAGRLSHGNEMLIDHEHFKHDSTQETRAYGWLQELSNRADGVYGRIRWTKTGKEAVDGGDYRFFSTEYDPGDLKVLNSGRSGNSALPTKVRPSRLDGLTLTNDNNNKGQRPITNREESRPGEAGNKNNQNERNRMKSMLAELDLSPEASEDAGRDAIRKLKNRVTTAEEKIGRVTELETQNGTLLDEQVDGLLSEHKITDTKVINWLKPLLKPLKNRAERIACLSDLGRKVGGTETTTTTTTAEDKGKSGSRVLNRGTGDGERKQPTAEEQSERQKANKIMNRAKAIMKESKVSQATAFKMAQDEEAA